MKLYGEAYEQKVEQVDALKLQLWTINHFLTNRVEEVKNDIGGVIGYTLTLNADETENLFKLVNE